MMYIEICRQKTSWTAASGYRWNRSTLSETVRSKFVDRANSKKKMSKIIREEVLEITYQGLGSHCRWLAGVETTRGKRNKRKKQRSKTERNVSKSEGHEFGGKSPLRPAGHTSNRTLLPSPNGRTCIRWTELDELYMRCTGYDAPTLPLRRVFLTEPRGRFSYTLYVPLLRYDHRVIILLWLRRTVTAAAAIVQCCHTRNRGRPTDDSIPARRRGPGRRAYARTHARACISGRTRRRRIPFVFAVRVLESLTWSARVRVRQPPRLAHAHARVNGVLYRYPTPPERACVCPTRRKWVHGAQSPPKLALCLPPLLSPPQTIYRYYKYYFPCIFGCSRFFFVFFPFRCHQFSTPFISLLSLCLRLLTSALGHVVLRPFDTRTYGTVLCPRAPTVRVARDPTRFSAKRRRTEEYH